MSDVQIRPIRLGSARKLTQAVASGLQKETNSDRFYPIGAE